MRNFDLHSQIAEDLRAAITRAIASGELMTAAQIDKQLATFRDRFGPDALRRINGEALLRLMHERDRPGARCLSYWLEFKNDEEFYGKRFGRIGGGAAYKFGIYQRQADGVWIGGSAQRQRVLSLEEAIAIAQQQRDELLAGLDQLGVLNTEDFSDAAYVDEAYTRLQADMERAAPNLSGDSWAHKYWFLMYPDRLDDYHSPRYQRFHLFKLLQIPPDGVGVLDMKAGRFLCAGRYVRLARALEVPTTSLLAVLNARDSALHRYWRVGTTSGSTGESQWEVMRAGSFVSIGWGDALGNLTEVIGGEPGPAKHKIRDWLLPSLENPGVATRKAGEVFNFCRVMEENDLVLACEGQDVIGVGRVRGSYRYDNGLTFPHLRPVEWLLVDKWKMPESEGLRTTVCEIGRKALNLLELERRLFVRGLPSSNLSPLTHSPAGAAGLADVETVPLPGLDPLMARIEATLTRKGQIVLYGPPGTGKTYWALKTARELAARKAFNKTFQLLTRTEQTEIDGAEGLVRVCTFHPGFGYEDFIEGLRPRTDRGQMLFEPRAGVFKRICAQAIQRPRRNFYLVVDEINRGDLPRIFGELITVLEYDKRGVEVILPLTGDLLIVPRNVFLIGTMNSADRSISLMDTAMRRRFAFLEMMPDSSVLGSRSVGGIPLGPWLDALNSRLRRHLKRDARHLQVGHSFFLPAQQVMSVADFGRVIREEIIPLLEEYCYDDFLTLKDILGGELVDVELGRFREDLFDPNREESLLQALTYEEMAAAMPAQAAEDDEFESPADASDDGDEA